jgi:hypothetical protein
MLNMTYAASDSAVAEKMTKDLSTAHLKLDHPMLIVVASPDGMKDESVNKAIKQAEKDNHRIAVVKVKAVSVPDSVGEFPPLDMSAKYDASRLVRYLNRVDMGMARVKRGQRLLFFIAVGALIMFAAAIWGIASGQVAFPQDEYATEFAFELNQISTFAAPTLDYLMPRTTEDALNFPATVERMPTRVVEFAIQTATALPSGMGATQEAIATAAVGTSAAMTQVAATATP